MEELVEEANLFLVSGLDGLRLAPKDLQKQALSRGGSDERLFTLSHERFAHIA